MRQPIARHVARLLCCLGAAGCGVKISTTHITPAAAVSFDGEWIGTWQSGSGAVDGGDADSGGTLAMRLQQFQGQPVVNVQIDNPCLPPRAYDLRLGSTAVELLADGEVVFGAVLGEGRTLVGTYQCAAATGSWNAVWQRDLPAIVDLSGGWRGTLAVPNGGPFDLEFTLQQTVRSGLLVLEGQAELPELLPTPMPVTGSVQFRDGSFEVVLQTTAASPVQFVVSGIGELAPVRLPSGFLQFFGPSPLPFAQGIVEIARQTPP